MYLKINKPLFWVGIVFQSILVAAAIGRDVALLISSNKTDGTEELILVRIVLLALLVGAGALLIFLEAFPSLLFFGPRRINANYYEIRPIYYNKNGPKESDAVVCLVRATHLSSWQLKIIALSHFIPEEAQQIRDLFDLETGEALLQEVFTIKPYSAQKGRILLFATPEEVQEEATDDSVIKESDN